MSLPSTAIFFFFFFNDTPPPEIYTLPLPDALPISPDTTPTTAAARCRPSTAAPTARSPQHFASRASPHPATAARQAATSATLAAGSSPDPASLPRSEEHTSELQSQSNLVCRLLLEK